MTPNTRLDSCPSCNCASRVAVGTFGSTHLCDDYSISRKARLQYPLDVYSCLECKLVYIDCVVNPEDIYDDYLYLTSTSPGLDDHFSKYAASVQPLIQNEQACIVDIGGNDGTLLRKFRNLGFTNLLNIEPAEKASDFSSQSGVSTLRSYLSQDVVRTIKTRGPVSCIIMNNMLANIPDLNNFLSLVLQLFDDHTIGVIESSYLLDMVLNNVIDFIYHEHLYYFCLASMQSLLARNGLEVFHVEKVTTKGGSMRYYIKRKSFVVDTQSSALFFTYEYEKNFFASYNLPQWFSTLSSQVLSASESFALNLPGSVPVYGASPTTASLMAFMPHLPVSVLIDDNPNKLGLYSPLRCSPPVISFDYIVIHRPKHLVIAAWRFASQILAKLRKISDYDPIIYIPLPNTIVGKLSSIELENAAAQCSSSQ
jgi:hypothetical protein